MVDKFNSLWPSDCRDHAAPVGIVAANAMLSLALPTPPSNTSGASIRSGVLPVAMRSSGKGNQPSRAEHGAQTGRQPQSQAEGVVASACVASGGGEQDQRAIGRQFKHRSRSMGTRAGAAGRPAPQARIPTPQRPVE